MNKTILCAAALACGATAAFAENEISVYGGVQTLPHAVLSGSGMPGGENKTIGWEGRSFEAPPYYGLRYMHWSGDWGWGAEITHAKAYAPKDEMPAGFSRLEFSDGLNIATVNVARRWQWNTMQPYAGVGLGIAVPHVDVLDGADKTFGYQYSGPALRLTAGVQAPISDHFDIFGEYQMTYTQNSVSLDNDGGDLNVDLITNAFNVGISYNF